MKKNLLLLFLMATAFVYAQPQPIPNGVRTPFILSTTGGGLGINNQLPKAALDVKSTTNGILIPRLTTAEKNAIALPTVSEILFDKDLGVFQYYNGTTWVDLDSSGGGGSQNLQQVTDEGNITDNEIISKTVVGGPDGDFYAKLKPNGSLEVYSPDSTNLVTADSYGITSNGVLYTYPNTTTSRIATLLDVSGATGDYVPLAGTETGNPVTGDIKLDNSSTARRLNATDSGSYIEMATDGTVSINDESGGNVALSGILIKGNTPLVKGITGVYDYSANITDLDYTQKKYVDDALSAATGSYIPLSGTESGSPITGNLEYQSPSDDPNTAKGYYNLVSGYGGGFTHLSDGGSSVPAIWYKDPVNSNTFTANSDFYAINSDKALFKGISSDTYFGANYDNNSFVQKKYVDDSIAAIPATTNITGNAGTATALQNTRTIGIITGDATSAGSSFNGTANNTNTLTLATVNSNVGTFGSATQVATPTVDNKGRITGITNTSIQINIGQVNALNTNLNLKKSIATGNSYRFSTTDSGGAMQETAVTPNRLVVTDSNGLPVASSVTDTQASYLNTLTGNVQTQFNNILSTEMVVNTTTTGISSATLNSTYPNVPVGYRVICPSITLGGAIYTKATEAGSSDVWLMCSAPVAP